MTPSWLPLAGAANARDVAGLPTLTGSTVRPGVLLRSDNLQGLTPADVRHLVEELGLARVVDLRTRGEVDSEGPGPLRAAGVEHRHLSLIPEDTPAEGADDERVLPDRREQDMGDVYLSYLDLLPGPVVEAVAAVAEAPGATVVHCAAGKDRTGVVVALALSAAGVTREAVLADFLATNTRIEGVVARLKASPTYGDDLRDRPAGDFAVRRETLEKLLDTLDERHGSPTGWLLDHGLERDTLDLLTRRLLGQPAR